jgi:hypothetical protein
MSSKKLIAENLGGRSRVLIEDTTSAFIWRDRKIVKKFSQDTRLLAVQTT